MQHKFKIDKKELGVFCKTGIVVLSFLVICFLGIKYVPEAVTVTNHTNAKELPIYSVETKDKKVALTFNVATGNENLYELLTILDDYNVRATFFITGSWVDQYPEDLKAIAASGHDLGNRSENHRHMSKLSYEESKEEIQMLHEKVKNVTGIEMNLFRVPYDDYNNTIIQSAKALGYHTVRWDINSEDWRDYGTNDIIKRCTQDENLGNGSILLLHTGTKFTIHAMEDVITELQNQKYELVPISELIYMNDYTVDLSGRQYQK